MAVNLPGKGDITEDEIKVRIQEDQDRALFSSFLLSTPPTLYSIFVLLREQVFRASTTVLLLVCLLKLLVCTVQSLYWCAVFAQPFLRLCPAKILLQKFFYQFRLSVAEPSTICFRCGGGGLFRCLVAAHEQNPDQRQG